MSLLNKSFVSVFVRASKSFRLPFEACRYAVNGTSINAANISSHFQIPLPRYNDAKLTRTFTRSFHHMYCKPDFSQPVGFSNKCSCGCHTHLIHTKGDKELVDFLSEEIAAEQKNVKMAKLPVRLDDFDVKLDQSEVTLEKRFNEETISISFNVNHSVDADSSDETKEPAQDEAVDMKSQPNFEVDIKKGQKTLSFSCSYSLDEEPQPGEDAYSDIFNIDEVVLYEGEFSDKTYAVSGEILDGVLYDLFMNLLEERGLSNEFVGKLSDFASTYEHKCYIAMLQGIQSFVKEGH